MMKRLLTKLAICLSLTTPLAAELFHYPYLSATAQSASFAGAAAAASDITFQYYNPASINYHYKTELAFVPSVYWPRSRSFVEGTTITGDVIPGNGTGKSDGSFSPGFGVYGAHAVSDHVHVGVSITTPWIMNTKYDGDFVGRYYGLKSEIYSANITPIVAISWLNFLSFGVGPQFQFFSFDFTQAIDFGSLGQQAGIEGALPGEQDGFETLGLGEWGSGWAIGLIAQPCPYIRLGGGYRSHIHYSFCFHPRYKLGDIGADVVAATGLFQEGYFSRLKIQTPDLAWASLNYSHSACWDFMAGFSYRNWEKGIVVRNDNPGQGKTIILSGLHHVCSYMVGAKYQHPSKAYTWRVGVAYDHDALDAEHANPLFFVDHNLLVSCGGEWCLPYGGKVSIAYSHNYMWEAGIAQEEVSLTRGTLLGKAKYDSDIITLQVVKAF